MKKDIAKENEYSDYFLEDDLLMDDNIDWESSWEERGRPSIRSLAVRVIRAEAEVKRLTEELEDCRETIIKEWLSGKDYTKTDEGVEIYLHFTIHRVFFQEYYDGTLYSEGYRSLNNPTIFKEDKITHSTLHFYAEEIKERGQNGSKIK